MANAAEASNPDKECSDKNFSGRDSSNESTDSEADRDFSTENRNSSRDQKLASSTLYNVKKKPSAIAKQEWKRRFRYLSCKHFLRHTRAVNDRQTGEGLSPRQNKKREEESDGFYADDKGYLQSEIYDEVEDDEELGFTGDVSRKLNLIPPLTGHERTLEDAELLRTDFQSDSYIPEIIVVPSAQFVREISSGN